MTTDGIVRVPELLDRCTGECANEDEREATSPDETHQSPSCDTPVSSGEDAKVLDKNTRFNHEESKVVYDNAHVEELEEVSTWKAEQRREDSPSVSSRFC